ncbi:NAD(P)H-dependent glycerol-3-phosphate dehydrogenase [Candidatus Endowatersipora endosymbiont of Watersipora subatra]|uniref:NAD(P)H-dependent glycerol-3-phosphate dehydrogenase n=1 Tax=Candidatus Endowatersipora endosymbiont of Watersipora subatra TaxID=3077946 RepID=UPI00312CAB98
MSHRIAIIGAGAWGTALACAWGSKGHKITLVTRDARTAESIRSNRHNNQCLPGIMLPNSIEVTNGHNVLKNSDIIAFSTPAQAFSETLKTCKAYLQSGQSIVLCSKGIDQKSETTLTQIAREQQPYLCRFVLSGPSFAVDVANGLPAAVTLASSQRKKTDWLAGILSTERLRVYSSTDVIGVEMGGALKNVLAIAVGIARGLKLGVSAEAALISRGFLEMTRLAIAMGARRETLTGLSGLGDLALCCANPQSRNFCYGIILGQGKNNTHYPLTEGIFTADVARKVAKQHNIEVPIIETVCQILNGQVTPIEAVSHLLSRPLKGEDLEGRDSKREQL